MTAYWQAAAAGDQRRHRIAGMFIMCMPSSLHIVMRCKRHFKRPVSEPASTILFLFILQKAYADLGYGPGDFPVTEALANRFLSLPIYAELQPEQVAEVVLALEKASLVEAA